jgi:hypothetical protein
MEFGSEPKELRSEAYELGSEPFKLGSEPFGVGSELIEPKIYVLFVKNTKLLYVMYVVNIKTATI